MADEVLVDCSTGEVTVQPDTFLPSKPVAPAMPVPTVAPGANAGNGASVSLLAGSRDNTGAVLATAGTSPTVGEMVKVTFATPKDTAPVFILVGALGVQAGTLVAANITPTGFSIISSAAPAAGSIHTLGWHITIG